MLFIGLIFIAAIIAMSLFDGDNSEKVMSDFCKVECKQNLRSKYKFCC